MIFIRKEQNKSLMKIKVNKGLFLIEISLMVKEMMNLLLAKITKIKAILNQKDPMKSNFGFVLVMSM
jgi:hypothetical protein